MGSQRHNVYIQGLAADGAQNAEGMAAMGFTPEPIDPNAMVEQGATASPIIDTLGNFEAPRSGFELVVNGRMFEYWDNVFIDSVPYPTEYNSTIRLTATITAAANLSVGIHKVTVGMSSRRSNELNLKVF